MQTLQISLADINAQEQKCRDQVLDRATRCQLKVLYLLAEGLTPLEVAIRLKRSIKTIDAHKTQIFNLCYNAWDLPHKKTLNYHFLHKKFAHVTSKAPAQPQSKELSSEEYACCARVIAQATRCQLKVLRLLADGLTPQEVADQLNIVVKTVHTHKTELLALCCHEWKLPHDGRLNYHFLNEKFAAFFSYAHQKTPNPIE